MKTLKFQAILLFVVVLFSTTANFFSQRGNNGLEQNSNYKRLFNLQTIETLEATVIAVEQVLPDAKKAYDIHLKVKTKTDTIYVHLGPKWYIDIQDIQFKTDDLITITGSRVTYQNAPAIVAINIKKDDYTLHLRNKNGHPTWSRPRKNRKGSIN